MDIKSFEKFLEDVFDQIRELERRKRAEYVMNANDDRFSHFKEIGAITGEPAHQVLRGMMVKHTKSIYDMLKFPELVDHDLASWNEKINDHLVYLILLKALTAERFEHAKALSAPQNHSDPEDQGPTPFDKLGCGYNAKAAR
jgi:hypothetical protein